MPIPQHRAESPNHGYPGGAGSGAVALARPRAPTPGRSPAPTPPGTPGAAGRPGVPQILAQYVGQPRRTPAQTPSPRGQRTFVKGDLVDYWSGSFQSWIAAVVTGVDPETGMIYLDVKPQGIALQDQGSVLRPRQKPGQQQLQWMHLVMREGRIHEEARALFSVHAVLDSRCGQRVLTHDRIPLVAGDIDRLLGTCGSIKGLMIEIRKAEQEVLTMDAFTSAFWDQICTAYHTYGSALPKQPDSFHRQQDPRRAYNFDGAKALGGGTYGQVKLVTELKTGNKRAIKIISKKSMVGSMDMLQAEVDNLCTMDHPHIAKLYEYFEDAENLYLVMDFCSGGDLQHTVSNANKNRKNLPVSWSADVMRQVLLAVVHIHAHGILHLDLKCANIMLMPSMKTLPPVKGAPLDDGMQGLERPHVMVIDLGVSQFFRPGDFRYNSPMGTPVTMAPEVWHGELTPKADIFSCGAVLYELLALRLAWPYVPSKTEEALRYWAQQPSTDFSLPERVSPEGTALCRQMLALSRHQRPTASQCLVDTFLRTFDGFQGPLNIQVPADIVRRLARLPERSVLYMSIALAIARRWPANQWPTVKRWFNELNVAGSGRLEKQQVSEALQNAGVPKAQACKAAEAMDLSRDGSVGWTEFVAACIDLGSPEFEATLREAFEEADGDDDGLLTQKDLSKLLPSGYASERVQDVFHDLTGRRESGARIDWPTFRKHFGAPAGHGGHEGPGNARAPAGLSAVQAVNLHCQGLAFPELFGFVREQADKAVSRWFPTPGSPEREEEQLRVLREMGFHNRERCLDVLRRHRGDLSGSAVEELCNFAS